MSRCAVCNPRAGDLWCLGGGDMVYLLVDYANPIQIRVTSSSGDRWRLTSSDIFARRIKSNNAKAELICRAEAGEFPWCDQRKWNLSEIPYPSLEDSLSFIKGILARITYDQLDNGMSDLLYNRLAWAFDSIFNDFSVTPYERRARHAKWLQTLELHNVTEDQFFEAMEQRLPAAG